MQPRILLVDDDKNNLFLLAKMLAPYGRVEQTTNGYVALAMYKASLESDNRFYLLFLDIEMPEINGREVLRQLREYEELYLRMDDFQATVVMATANSNKDVIEQSFKEGCEYYMLKPYRAEQIKKVMDNLGVKAREPIFR